MEDSVENTLSVNFIVNHEPVEVTLPAVGDGSLRSCFAIGLPKAGSTLLNSVLARVARRCGLGFVNIPAQLHQAGVKASDIPADVNALFLPRGYLYGGFRGVPANLHIPDWASGRTLVLVRDPRDMLVSLYYSQAYSHRPPGSGAGGELRREFDRQREEACLLPIDTFVLEGVSNLVVTHRQMKEKTAHLNPKLYRYEDIIFNKEDWIRDMLGYLGLTIAAPHIARIAESVDIRPEVEEPSKHVRKVSPGDHREKLQPETIERLNAAFAPILATYGY